MDSASLYIQGVVSATRESSFNGETKKYAQFLVLGDNGLDVLNIKMQENVQKDTEVMIPVKIVAIEGKVYYSQDGPLRVKK